MTYKTQHDVINSRATNEEDKTKEIHEYTRARVDVLQQIWMKKQKGRKIPHKKYCRKNIPFFNHPTQPAASERPERKCQFRDVPRLRLPPEILWAGALNPGPSLRTRTCGVGPDVMRHESCWEYRSQNSAPIMPRFSVFVEIEAEEVGRGDSSFLF